MTQPQSGYYKFYVKRLNAQELGYRKGVLATGAYWYISKKAAAHFFPPLEKLIHNDSSNIHLYTHNSVERVNITYVYHNDRHSVRYGTRDEYRIYLNRHIAPSDYTYKPGDILIFERVGLMDFNLFHIAPIDPIHNKLSLFLAPLGRQNSHFLTERLPAFMDGHLD